MMTAATSQIENHSMAWYHSHTLPGQCMSYRSLRRGSTISSRVESCSCELEVQAVARRLHGMFSLHHAQHAAILRSHAPTIPRMHSVFLGPLGWQLTPAESGSQARAHRQGTSRAHIRLPRVRGHSPRWHRRRMRSPLLASRRGWAVAGLGQGQTLTKLPGRA